MLNKARLRFNKYEVTKIVFEKPVGFSNEDFEISLKHNNEFGSPDESGDTEVVSDFILELKEENSEFNLQIQILGYFTIVGEVSEDVRYNFEEISIPSLLYPYIRAIVSTIVVQSGAKPIILPPINFGHRPKTESSESEQDSPVSESQD